jgi:uncharacterized protein (UPF0297 family)
MKQIVGYLLTEDPTYITNHNDARLITRKLARNDLLQDIVADYFAANDTGNATEAGETSSPIQSQS